MAWQRETRGEVCCSAATITFELCCQWSQSDVIQVVLIHAVIALSQFRIVALLEGFSFVVLLFIALPLKYLADMPLAVRFAGSIHGLLFLVFIAALYRASTERHWPFRRTLLAVIASVVPFGTFVFERSLRREIATAP